MGLLEKLTVGGRNPDAEGVRTFTYEAVSGATGERRSDRMNATSKEAVAEQLQRTGWFPVKIDDEATGLNVDIGQLLQSQELRLKPSELSEFARQLYQMLLAGINAPSAISSIGEDADSDKMRETTREIASKVTAGVPLSEAFAEHPKAFDDVFCAYVQAGETSGTLVETMGRLALMLQKRSELINKVKGVTAYPKMVGGAIGVITTGIILFLVPMFADIYAEFGAELPAPTQALVTMSKWFPLVIGVFLAAFFGLRWWTRQEHEPDVMIKIDRVRFRMPIFGKLNHKSALYRWSSTLSGAYQAGVQAYEAIELAARASGSLWMIAIAPDLAQAVREGRPLTSELKLHPDLFPANVRTMVATGEETGDIPEMLASVATSLDSDVDRIVATLSSKIEVALLLVLGTVVGGLLAVLYLPILNLANTAMQGLS